jgi:translation initiation factor IF-2
MRIYELAKQLNAKSEVLVDLLLIAGFDIKGHMSRLDDSMFVEISEHFKLPPDLAKRAKTAKAAIAKKEAEEAKAGHTAKVAKTVKAKVAPRVAGKVIRKARPVPPPEVVEEKKAPEEPQAPAKKVVTAGAEPKAKPAEPEMVEPGAAKPVEIEPAKVEAMPESKLEVAAPGKPGVAAQPAVAEAKTKPKTKIETAGPAKVVPKPTEKAVRPHGGPREPVKIEGRPKGPHKKLERPKIRITDEVLDDTLVIPPPHKPKVGKKREVVDVEAQQKAVRESVRRTLARIETTRKTKRRKGKPQEEGIAVEKAVQVMEGMTVRELAAAFKLEPNAIIKKCFELGLPVTINQSLEKDTIELLSEDLGQVVEFATDEFGTLLTPEREIDTARLKPRAPIVTIMGHVDHGKTSILDFIRHTKVAAGEAGGITQHVGAYEVETPSGKITFIDTPGHEAFTSMRARGAQVTDVVVLVVAADDGVMPQTVEAINHAKDAGVLIMVAVNKIDLPTAKPLQVKKQLADMGIVAEDYGGDVIMVDVSARTGEGIDRLLEMILLQADVMELKADSEASGRGVAIEVRKEEGRGILCTVLVTQGTLRVGDVFVIGHHYGKVRALLDYRGRAVKEAPPSMPVVVLGCNGLPQAGDRLTVVAEEKEARELSVRRQITAKERERRAAKKLTLEELYTQIEQGAVKELRLVVKGDTNGSIEALNESLARQSVENVGVKVIHAGVGVVNESDLLLADTSGAIVIAFNVKVAPKAQELAESQNIEIRSYEIIYECISDVQKALQGMLEPERVERVLGKATVRQVFRISKLGLVAGCYVVEGSITRNALVRVLRDDEVVFQGKIATLKRFQDDAREVQKDFECGIGIGGLSDLQEGDVIEAYVVEEKARTF